MRPRGTEESETCVGSQSGRDGFDQASLWVLDGNVRARRFDERDSWVCMLV